MEPDSANPAPDSASVSFTLLCQCSVVIGKGKWKKAEICRRSDNGSLIILRHLRVTHFYRARQETLTVRVSSECPLSLFDELVETGYYVLGMPNSKL